VKGEKKILVKKEGNTQKEKTKKKVPIIIFLNPISNI